MGLSDRILAQMCRLLQAGVSGQVFPGASACVALRDGDRWSFHDAVAGLLAPGEPRVQRATRYDLASLTKPVVAMTAARLSQAGRLDLDANIPTLLPEARGALLDEVSLERAFTHRSGLEAWGGIYLDVPHTPGSAAALRWVVAEASRREHLGDEEQVYSDLGYIVAGAALAKAMSTPLDELVNEEVLVPVGAAATVCYPGALSTAERARFAQGVPPTERCEWRGKLIRGEVHDENCAALGGVSGHAGLFGDARGVAAFGVAMLDCMAKRSEWLSAATLEFVFEPRSGGTHRFGWDTKAPPGTGKPSAAGTLMGAKTFGHLGFTGTSIWCDPEAEVCIVLLSNRVHPSRANIKIRGFRPAFYDGVMKVLAAR